MSFETRVFENGAWVTRVVGLQEAVEANRRREEAKTKLQAPKPKPREVPPSIGILTRTLVQSPVIRWIIPARIRNKDKNDVIFIGVRTKPILTIDVVLCAYSWTIG